MLLVYTINGNMVRIYYPSSLLVFMSHAFSWLLLFLHRASFPLMAGPLNFKPFDNELSGFYLHFDS